ncbi:MAG: 50S ribosomal protein L11 methyltransferase [Tannerella sp.]|jgi:ribosomal protein L11 methyltransferase|nr:50S ribosomal protein L11 methyltransferase [Tannerella sp.]
MEYCKLSFSYESPIETDIINDLLASELGSIGFESFVPDDGGLTAFIAIDKYDRSSMNNCLENFPVPGITFHHTEELIKEQNWNEEWEKNYFQPIRIGDECMIRASFHPEENGFKHPIIIDPKMAFGTGNHATTYLMLCEMLKLDLKNREVLDIGCGTAVLAILAARKDASRVVAIDIDEWAYSNAIENCRLNNATKIQVVLGGAEQIKNFGMFDSIFANINRNILLNDIHSYVPALKKDGLLFMSGFYQQDLPVIEDECNKNGLHLLSFTEQDNWVAVKTQNRIKPDIS